jgi:ribosome biogenesis GTPase A
MDGFHLIEAVAKKRGYRLKGGEYDLEKSALTLLQDYRDGTLGRVSLETPKSREEMLLAAKPLIETSSDTLDQT